MATLVDNAGVYAASALIEAKKALFTVEFKVNLPSPATGKRLRAVGNVIRAGQILSTSQVEVFAITGGGEKRARSGL